MPTNYLAQTKSPGLIFLWQNNCSARGMQLGGTEGQAGSTCSATVAPSTCCHTVDADGDARQTKD